MAIVKGECNMEFEYWKLLKKALSELNSHSVKLFDVTIASGWLEVSILLRLVQ